VFKFQNKKFLLGLLMIFCYANSTRVAALANSNLAPDLKCKRNQSARSIELQSIVNRDQADREGFEKFTKDELIRMYSMDKKRRMRVGEIFGEGCFDNAKDYAAAALVYQHGDKPDHYWQAFMWFKKAMELGASGQQRNMALAIDRYLVNMGHKQLFLTQALTEGDCVCLAPAEESFPEKKREGVMGRSLDETFEWIESLNEGNECPTKNYCKNLNLKSTPKGSVIGYW
jgi:hypothetical protein